MNDLENAYLLGIRDGFRLARADTMAEAEELIAEVKADIPAKMRAVQAELAARGHPVEDEREPDKPLN